MTASPSKRPSLTRTLLLLSADKQAEYGKVIAVLDELKALGIRRVAVATEQMRGEAY